MYLMDYYTIPVSLAGLPSLSVPCGSASRRTVRHAPDAARPRAHERRCSPERALLGYAHAYERGTQHAQRQARARAIPAAASIGGAA
jgi:hypothetical protein